MRLTDEQIVNQGMDPKIGSSAESPAATAPPAIVMQRTGDKNLNRYRPVTSKILHETEHTIKMSNGAVLRKLGLALRKNTNPRKRALGAPPTSQEVKRKMMTTQPSIFRGTQSSSKSKLAKQSRNMEGDDDSDSDEDDDLPLAAKHMLGRAAPVLVGNCATEDVQTTTGTQGAKRPTAELGEQATTSAKRPMVTTI